MVVGQSVAQAQTPENKTATTGNDPTLIYFIPSFTATVTPALRYRFNSVPSAGTVLYRGNADGTGAFVNAAANSVVTSAQAGTLAYNPANTANNTGTFTFTYAASAQSTAGTFNGNATYTINVVIVAEDQTAVIMSNTNGQTPIPALTVNSTLTPAKYRILTFPTASQGLLYVNGTQVTVARDLTVAEAGQLTFDPAAGFAGNAFFTFAAADASNNLGTTGQYSLPVSKAACGVTTALDFSRRTAGEDWKARSAVVGTTTVATSGYSSSVTGTNTNTFAVGNNGTLPGPSLVWQQNNIGNNPSLVSNVATVTYTFSRPVNNLSMVVSDIDKDVTAANFIDELTFDGYATAGSTTPVALGAADVALVAGVNQLLTGTNTVQGIGVSNADPAGTVVITFPSPVQRITLTYRNTAPYVDATTNRTQTVGIPSLTFCSQADVFAQFSSGTTATTTGSNVNYTVDFGNNGPDPADPLARIVTLPAGVANVVVPTGATYNATTRIIDFGSATVASGGTATFAFSFNAPLTAGTYSIIANASSPTEDIVTTNNTAVRTLVVSDCATTTSLNYVTVTPTGIRRGAINGGTASQGPTTDAAVDGITINYQNYTSTTPTLQNDFAVGTSAATLGQSLTWQLTSDAANTQASVTLLLSKPVDNLTINLQDVDGNLTTFIDQLKFDGFENATSTTAATLTAANFTNGTGNSFIGNNTVRATAAANPGDAIGNLTVRFTAPVQRLVLTYSNQATSTANGRQQVIGINSLTYCSPADVATTVTAAATPVSGGAQGQFNVIFINNGPNAAANVTRQVQLAAGLVGVSATNGGTYNSASGLVSYTNSATLASGATLNSTITFTTPNTGTVTATAVINTTSSEGGLTANNTASADIVSTPVANVATVITGPVSVNAAQTATLNVSFSNVGALDASTVTRTVTLPAGVTNVAAAGGTVTGNVAAGYTVTYPTLATLAAGASNTFTITYTAPASGTVTATSNTSTTSQEGGLTANNTSSVTTTVGLVADVTTTLAGPTALNAGQPSGNYTVAFTNNGPSTASAVTRQVTLPAGVTNVVVNGTPVTPTAGIIDFGPAATLASGVTNLFTFSFTASTTAGAATVTSSTSTATNQGANAAADNANLSVTVGATANVAATITAGAASATPGQTGTFNVSFSNSGPQAAAGVVPSVQLPAGLVGVVATNGGIYDSFTGVVSYSGLTTLANGASTASVITFTVPVAGPVTATASISTTTNEAGQTANNRANAAISVTPTYDVTTVITGPATTAVGVQTTLSIATVNNGPSVAPSVVQTVTGLPTTLTNVYISNGGTYDATTGIVTFPALAALPTGTRADNTISFTPTTTASFTATATVTANTNNSGDSNTVNNSATAPATAVSAAPVASTNANLYTTITTPSANVAPAAATTFTVTSGNNGPGTATTVAQLVTLPAGLSGVVVKNSAGTVLAGAYNATTGVVSFPLITSLASGSSAVYTIDLTAPTSGLVAAVATISAATADAMPSNNIATVDVTVTPVTDVAVLLTGPNVAGAGTAATYTVTTTNNGPVTATSVVTAVSIPAGLTGVTVSGGGSYAPATGVVSFPAIATLLNGASTSNTITYTVPNIGTYANVASVTSTTVDNVLTNNTAVVKTVAEPLVDIVLSLNGPTSIVQGNQVDYVLAVVNNGSAPAANTAIRVQLPAGLGSVTSTGGTYNNTTGVLTFPAIATQIPGSDGAASYGIRFIAPTTLNSLYASASVSTGSEETNYANNVANTTTAATLATAGTTDLQILVTPSTTTPVAGQSLTLNISTTNLANANTTVTATNVVQRVALEPGLIIASITNGGTYDPISGVVTFPAVASITSGSSVANAIVLTTPGATPITTRGLVTGDQTDVVPANNVAFANIVITQRADVATSVSGPATAQPGDLVTYSVVTLNNGPSTATGVVQTVTLPAGATNVVVSGGGTLSGNIVTFPTITSQLAGAGGQVVNTVSFNNPSAFTTAYDVVANVTATSTQPAASTANDMATATTAKGNRVPVANAVTNTLQGAEGNTAGPLLISSLSGTDADGNTTIASYALTSIPNSVSQGVLRLNNTPVTATQVIAVADIARLTFDPVSTFVGNAFFTYTVLDNAGAVSAPAIYTIPVGQDLNSVYARPTTTKGGNANKYVAGDVLAYGIDPNAALYNTAGFVYDPATGAAPSIGTGSVDNGLQSASISAADAAILATNGIQFSPTTGLFTVADPTKLPRAGATLPAITVTTTDLNGGVNTNSVTLITGANPLPVELTAFTATAVKNIDAQLVWNTASEKNNDHFNVERSLNGISFVKIAQVKGQGTSSAPTAYALTDVGIGTRASGAVYYRLQQVDGDGTATYSPVRTITFSKTVALAITLFPNPAATATNLDLTQLPTGTYQVSLLDATGRVVLRSTLSAGLTHGLDVSPLASGTYTVLVRGQNGSEIINLTKRLIKE